MIETEELKHADIVIFKPADKIDIIIEIYDSQTNQWYAVCPFTFQILDKNLDSYFADSLFILSLYPNGSL